MSAAIQRPNVSGDKVLAAVMQRLRTRADSLYAEARQEGEARNFAAALAAMAASEEISRLRFEISSREWLESMWLVEPLAGDSEASR